MSCEIKESPLGQGSLVSESDGSNIIPLNKIPDGDKVTAIQNVTLIDGNGGDPVSDAVVIIEKNVITEIGTSGSVVIPDDAEIISGKGLSLLPGLIDAHFHLNNNELPNLVLKRGTTSLRDPGAWIESYQQVMESNIAVPRLFLTGPHLDMPPPAYPRNSYLIRDGIEARDAVNKFADQGASAIKVYFRLPVEIIKAVCSTAHQRGIPVTAHLEITSAMQAIEAGVDGIEHITSFGTDLLPTYHAEQYKQSIIADNSARREGRYHAWHAIDLSSERVDSLLSFLKQKGTVVSPTLGAFEHQFKKDTLDKLEASRLAPGSASNQLIDTIKVQAFENMKAFVGEINQAGIPVVVGSHSWVPYQKAVGWAFQREMELLAASGMTNMEVIQAATIENAKFLRVEDRLGTIEEGKQADLLLIEGNPLEDLQALYKVRSVMLNGRWVPND